MKVDACSSARRCTSRVMSKRLVVGVTYLIRRPSPLGLNTTPLCAQLVELQHSLLDRIDLMRLEPSQDRGPRDGVISQQVVALGEAGELGAVEAHQIERVQLHVVGDALRGRRGVWITAPRDLGAQDQIRICVEEGGQIDEIGEPILGERTDEAAAGEGEDAAVDPNDANVVAVDLLLQTKTVPRGSA